MASISQLTPAQLFTAVTAAGDSSGQIGRWTVDALASRNAILPTVMQPLRMVYNEAADLLTNAGYDINNLTDRQAADAYYAMAYACAYQLLLEDSAGASTLPAENFVTARQEFGQRVKVFFQLAGKHYDNLGIPRDTNPYYDNAAYRGSFELVTRDDATQDYPFNSSFTTIP